MRGRRKNLYILTKIQAFKTKSVMLPIQKIEQRKREENEKLYFFLLEINF